MHLAGVCSETLKIFHTVPEYTFRSMDCVHHKTHVKFWAVAYVLLNNVWIFSIPAPDIVSVNCI